MVVAARLSAIHRLTLALGLGGLFARGRALSRPLDEDGWRRLLNADNVWGAAALLWIASGFGRVFPGGRDPAFSWRSGFFWIKLALFGLVFLLEPADADTYPSAAGAEPARGPYLPFRSIAIAASTPSSSRSWSRSCSSRRSWREPRGCSDSVMRFIRRRFA